MAHVKLILVDLGGEEKVKDKFTLEPLLHELVLGDLTISVNIHCVPADGTYHKLINIDGKNH